MGSLRRSVGLVLFCALSAGCVHLVRRPLDEPRFSAVDGAAVRLRAETSRGAAETLAGALSAARSAVAFLTGLPADGLPPLRVLLVDPGESGALLPFEGAVLAVEGAGGEPLILGPADSAGARGTPAAHAVAHATLDALHVTGPRWLLEGLACLAQAAYRPNAKLQILGGVPKGMQEAVFDAPPGGPEVLLDEGRARTAALSSSGRAAFEAWSCLLVDRLSRPVKPFQQFVAALRGGAPVEQAFAEAYPEQTLPQVAADLWKRRRAIPGRARVIEGPRFEHGAAVRLDGYEALRARAEAWQAALAWTAAPGREQAGEQARLLLQGEPHAPQGLALLASLGRPQDPLRRQVEEALLARPGDALLLWLLSTLSSGPDRAALLEASVGRAPLPEALREQARKATEARPIGALAAALQAESAGDPEGRSALLVAALAAQTGRCAESAAALQRASLHARDGAPWAASLAERAAAALPCTPAAEEVLPVLPGPAALAPEGPCAAPAAAGASGLALVRLEVDASGAPALVEPLYGPDPLRAAAKAMLSGCRFAVGHPGQAVVPVAFSAAGGAP